jgi:HD-GYP domain-containing protein (c-di-GMP phosphodiesterase class II)
MGAKKTPAGSLDTATLTRHPRLATEHLRIGLFVAELDRPWLDTPFLLQGFSIDREEEIRALCEHCVHVYIDVALSDPTAVRAVRERLNAVSDNAGEAADTAIAREPDGTRRAESSMAELADAADTPATAGPRLELLDIPPPVRATATPANNDAPEHATDAPDPADDEATPARRRGSAKHGEAVSAESQERLRRFAIETAGTGAPESVRPRGRDSLMRSLGALLKAVVTLDRKLLMSVLAGRRERQEGTGAETAAALPSGPPARLSTWVDPKLVDKRAVPEGEVLRASERKLSSDADAADVGDKDMARLANRPLSASQAELDHELERLLPPGASRVTYRERSTVVEELPRARQAFAQSASALETLMADVQQQREIPLESAREAVGDMVTSMLDNPDAMLWVAQMRETHLATYQHGVRVSLYMIAVGRSLGLPREMIEALGLIGILADVGKTRVPRALLDKPGMLTPVEYRIAKDHVRLGLKALEADMPLAPEVRKGIAEHHERLDGSGYPRGLKGAEISIWGRIAGIADCFSALITDRPYAKAMAAQEALMSLYQWADTSFHGPLVEQFVQSVGVFPVGSLVELSNGEVAIVLAHNRARRLEPRVIVVADAQKNRIAEPFERDLFKQAAIAGAKPLRIQRGLAAGTYGLNLQDFYADEALALAQTA